MRRLNLAVQFVRVRGSTNLSAKPTVFFVSVWKRMSRKKLRKESRSSLTWPEYFFGMMESVRAKSKDIDTQFGCIITGPDNEIRTTGYNSFPRGLVDNVEERLIRPEKYFWMVHAETNAIFNAARMGTPLNGCIAYIDALPCGNCAQGIIQVGIKEIFYDKKKWQKYTRKRNRRGGTRNWVDDIEKAIVMLEECGVKITPFTS